MTPWRIRKETLGVFSQYAKRDKTEHISFYSGTKWKKFRFFISILDGFEQAKKPSHAIVPLKGRRHEQISVNGELYLHLERAYY